MDDTIKKYQIRNVKKSTRQRLKVFALAQGDIAISEALEALLDLAEKGK
jgi:hypothetical protein